MWLNDMLKFIKLLYFDFVAIFLSYCYQMVVNSFQSVYNWLGKQFLKYVGIILKTLKW